MPASQKKTGGCLCRDISQKPYDQNQRFFSKILQFFEEYMLYFKSMYCT
jgi:hypothetical protein